ncbi:MAG TPA: helix-turn-helix domain-containing protein [Gemmata sp.]|nr:helix-turn-helix domain-containing protein [Gemmata sp.]
MPRPALKFLPVDPEPVPTSPFAGGTMPVAAAAAEFGVSRTVLWEWVAEGRVRATKPGGKVLLSRSDIVAVLDAAEVRR